MKKSPSKKTTPRKPASTASSSEVSFDAVHFTMLKPLIQRALRSCLDPLLYTEGTDQPYHRVSILMDDDDEDDQSYISINYIPQEQQEQSLRDYKVTIEYKHLKSHAPGGVYLVPSLNSLRKFDGVIFVRRGPFTNGIFKFVLELPPTYNDVNTYPQIRFLSPVYNPHVYPDTGILDIKTGMYSSSLCEEGYLAHHSASPSLLRQRTLDGTPVGIIS